MTSARQAEKLGFDAIAAATSRVRFQTGVCVLSVLDPLRVAEDYASFDQLSRGRVELVIGKGNKLRQLPMFGVASGAPRG